MARPKLLGPYQIVEPLSESAEVRRWVARAAIDGATRRVELAVAKNEEAAGLLAQARGLERLEHPNSRTIVDYGLLEGRYYLALDDDEPTVKLGGGVVLPDSVVLEVGHALCGVLNHCQGSDVGYLLSLEEISLNSRGVVKLSGARLGAALPSLEDVAQLLVDLCSGGELRARLERVIEHGRLALERDDGADDDEEYGAGEDDESDFAALERLLSALGSSLDDPLSVASWVSLRRGRPESDDSEREQDEEDGETLVASLSNLVGDDDSDEFGEDTKVGFVQDAIEGAIDRATVLPKPAPDAALRPRAEDDQPVLPVDWEDLGEPPTVAFDGFSALIRPLPLRPATAPQQQVASSADHQPDAPAGDAPDPRDPGSGLRSAPIDPEAPLPPREEKTGMRRVPTREVSTTTEGSHSGMRPRPRRPPTGSAPAVGPQGGGLMRLTTRDVRRQRRPISTGVSRARNISSVVASPPKKRASKTRTRIDRTARMWLFVALGACAVALLAAIGIYLLL